MKEVESQFWKVFNSVLDRYQIEYSKSSPYSNKYKHVWERFHDQHIKNSIPLEYSEEEYKILNESFFKLLTQNSNDEPYYWEFCSGKTYSQTYLDRLNDYLKNHPDQDELDFLKGEFKNLKCFQTKYIYQMLCLDSCNFELDLVAFAKKFYFLKEQLSRFGYCPKIENEIVEKENGEPVVEIVHKVVPTTTESVKHESFDLKQKMLLLEELGILNSFQNSASGDLNKNRASKILNAITGHNADNIRKALASLESGTYTGTFKYRSDKIKIDEFIKSLG